MANLKTQSDVYTMCRGVGFTVTPAKIASAIAMVEAPAIRLIRPYADFDMVGDQALADAVWGFSYGGFQIRSQRAQKGTGGYRDEDTLLVPVNNCRSAYAIWQVQGFEAWSTYKDGSYRAYLQDLFPPTPGTYIVVSGDTLSGIGARLGIDWRTLASLNGLVSPYSLRIGQVIRLPYVEYRVVPGDTLSRIASAFGNGHTWQELAEYNHLANPNVLAVGQVIRIPTGG